MRFELSGSLVHPDPLVLQYDANSFLDVQPYVDLGYTHFDVICVGAGGGNGGGIDTANSGTGIRSYGGAGGGGGFQRVRGLLSALPKSCPIVVGTKGADGTSHASTPGLTTDGDDGGYSSFNETTCRASGGKGGKRVQSNSTTIGTEADGGDGGIGNRIIAGGGAAGGVAGIPSDTGPGYPGLPGADGTFFNNIGKGGGGGAGGVGLYSGVTCNAATAGGRGSYNPGDTSVYGPKNSPGNDISSGAQSIIPGAGGGAKASPLNGLPTVYGKSGEDGIVLIRLTAQVVATGGNPVVPPTPDEEPGSYRGFFASHFVFGRSTIGKLKTKSAVAAVFNFGRSVAGSMSSSTPPSASGVSYEVNPSGFATTVVVEYGTDFKAFTQATSPVSIGSGSSPVTGSIDLPALTPNTVWFYRIKATNVYGQSISNTKWLVTPATAGTTRHVGSGQQYATIDDAIGDCTIGGGDTIVVHTGRYSITRARSFTGLTRILRNGTDVVNITRISGSRSNVYFGPGLVIDGYQLADQTDNSVIDHTNCSNIYFDGVSINCGESYVNRVNTMMNWHGGVSWIWMMGCTSNGGSGIKNYSGAQGNPADWPSHIRFLETTFQRASWDNTHSDGVNDIVYDHCIFQDPDLHNVTSEHHDGVQIAYGTDVTIRRCIFQDTQGQTPNVNTLEQGVILGEGQGLWASSVLIQSCLFKNIVGRAIVSQGSDVKVRNVTSYNNAGYTGGGMSYDDFNFGRAGSAENVKSTVFHMLGLNSGGTTPVLDYCHIESPNSDSASATHSTTGTPNYAGAPSNLAPSTSGNLYRSGISDEYSLPWDLNGRGWEGAPSKGCYVDANVRSPIVVDTDYTQGGDVSQQTPVAEVSLGTYETPISRTNHSIHIRARTTSGSTGVIMAALYEGGVNRSGDLASGILANSFGDHTLVIPDAMAATISNYTNLSIRFWGYDSAGADLTFEVADLYLQLPAVTTDSSQTPIAEVSLGSHATPASRDSHSIHIRARTTTGSSGVIMAALYEGANNRSGNLASGALTNSFANYTLSIPSNLAATITDYSNLSIKFWGYDVNGAALSFEVADLYLELPA